MLNSSVARQASRLDCHSQSCSNIESNVTDKDSYKINEGTNNASFLEQFVNIKKKKKIMKKTLLLLSVRPPFP